MAKSSAKNLKLYTEQPRKTTPPPPMEASGSLLEVLRAFTKLTGWSLRYSSEPEPGQRNDLTWSAPVSPGDGTTLGHLRLAPLGPDQADSLQSEPVEFDAARSMASALAGMVEELMQTRRALWQREAELAAGVPLVPHPEEEKHLATRLQSVLKGGAQAVGCQAAALYLLDDATSELKLRSSWGLPFDRLTAPARRLQGAVADLEALLGHAVVLEDPSTMQYWRVPENFPAAVCIPVSTPTMILGTLWIYGDQGRNFTDHDTNLLEVVAGRLAADLEREMLLREGVDGAELKRQVGAAERLQRNQLPTISPLLDGWEVSAWTDQSQAVGGDFYDWFCLPDGLLAATVGDSMQRGLEAAMAANALKAAVRAHGQYHREALQAIKQLNLTLWTGSAGDQYASLFYGLIETASGEVSYCMAGQPAMVVVRPDGWDSLSHASPQLGESPETEYRQYTYRLQPGEALLIFTDGMRDALDAQGGQLGEAGIAEPLVGRLGLSADQLAILAREKFLDQAAKPDVDDRSLLVIKRTGS